MMTMRAPILDGAGQSAGADGNGWVVARIAAVLLLVMALVAGQLGLAHPANAEARIQVLAGETYTGDNSLRALDGEFRSLKPLAPGLETRSAANTDPGGDDGGRPIVPVAQLPALPAPGLVHPCPDPDLPTVHPALFVHFLACAPPSARS
jgi:hypothetical protein